MKGLFLYNPNDLNSEIPGGVQICSQEFLKIIKASVTDLDMFEVHLSRSLIFRILHKLSLDNYQSYYTKTFKKPLQVVINEKEIDYIFINKAELLRFSKLIKELKLKKIPQIIIMSHGNDSGDHLGDLTSINPRLKGVFKFFGIIKLGINIFTESWYRKRYVDLVCTMSEEESSIEKWLGINNTFFIPRLIQKTQSLSKMPKQNVFGYVGTLSHTPNITALHQLFEHLLVNQFPLEIRIVGGPIQIGKDLAKKYPFVTYLGALSENNLLQEVKIWSFFINPIFNYSRGASMKLAKAIDWEIPVITTIAGRRGYLWSDGKMLETENSPEAFANMMKNCTTPLYDYKELTAEIAKIKLSCITSVDLAKRFKSNLEKLHSTVI